MERGVVNPWGGEEAGWYLLWCDVEELELWLSLGQESVDGVVVRVVSTELLCRHLEGKGGGGGRTYV